MGSEITKPYVAFVAETAVSPFGTILHAQRSK